MSQRRSNKNRQPKPADPTKGNVTAREPSAAVSRRAQRRLAEERSRRRQRMMMFGGAIALAVIVVGALIFLNRPDDDDDDAVDLALTTPPARDTSIPMDGRTLGNPDAPVTIIEYADFQCPACGTFATTVEHQLIEDYVKTGQARIVFHDFPFLDDRSDDKESDDASEAAFCAQDQGQFWAYHDMLYYNQSGENRGAFARERLIEMARNVEGIDVEQFTSCIDGDQFEENVQQLHQETIAAGVNSTPTFDVNGQRVSGTNYPALQQVIEAALGS